MKKEPALENTIYARFFFPPVSSLGEQVSSPFLCERALEMNKKLNGNPDFKAN